MELVHHSNGPIKMKLYSFASIKIMKLVAEHILTNSIQTVEGCHHFMSPIYVNNIRDISTDPETAKQRCYTSLLKFWNGKCNEFFEIPDF